MPPYYLISDRNHDPIKNTFGSTRGPVTYWTTAQGPLHNIANWTQILPTPTASAADNFKRLILAAIAAFPAITDPARHEDQQHVTLFVHGYNNTWAAEADVYETLCQNLFSGPDSVGIAIWFDWPSKGWVGGYLPDRADARDCAPDLADILDEFYDWLLVSQQSAAHDPTNPALLCRAKTSLIAHSMGNFLLQKAMQLLWLRKNKPLLVSLLTQLIMVAADVDNDLFATGNSHTDTDGDAIAALTYRVTALYSGLDSVLGLSAGLKHFGKRRLGRSGLDPAAPIPDNVWAIDCTQFLSGGPNFPDTWAVHSIYFSNPTIIELMRQLFKGVDRTILTARNYSGP